MDQAHLYNGSLTAEQFLFYEIRIAAKYYIDGKTIEEAIEIIKKDNLFQYPTERQVSRLARACYKRLGALNNEQLVHELAFAPSLGIYDTGHRRKIQQSGFQFFTERPECVLYPASSTERFCLCMERKYSQ